MSHANSGHTDRATINARKPLTEGMRETLRRLSGRDGIALRHTTTGTKNQVRALVDRGMAVYEGSDFAFITDAGRNELKSTR